MSEFQDVGALADLADPSRTLVELGDRVVVLVRIGASVYCLDDVCTHDGGPLADGRLEGFSLACPRHGAKFDVRTGRALTMPATQPTTAHETRIEGGRVLVKLTEE